MEKRRSPGFVVVTTVVLACAVTLASPAAYAQRPTVMSWKIGFESRTAWVYPPSVPSTDGKVPVVFSFHGRGDVVQNFQRTGLQTAFPDAVVVYPQGSKIRPDGNPGWQTETGQDDERDLQLVDAMLVSLRQTYNIDETRVYATGFSNGAGFTYLLWAERPHVFAAFAPVAGRLRPSVVPKHPRPVFHIAGEYDATTPFAEQIAAIETALRVNGLDHTAEPCGPGCKLLGGATAAPVMAWIHSGGHDYPGNTAERIVEFFRKYRRTP